MDGVNNLLSCDDSLLQALERAKCSHKPLDFKVKYSNVTFYTMMKEKSSEDKIMRKRSSKYCDRGMMEYCKKNHFPLTMSYSFLHISSFDGLLRPQSRLMLIA